MLAAKKTFWLVALAVSIKAFIGYGQAPFAASFFFRNHTAELASLAALFWRARKTIREDMVA